MNEPGLPLIPAGTLDLHENDRTNGIVGAITGPIVLLSKLVKLRAPASVNEDSDTIMDVWEPYLLQLGFLERTPRGRVATRLAHEYLGRSFVGHDSGPGPQGRLSGF